MSQKASIQTMRKYIKQTKELDQKRSNLSKEMGQLLGGTMQAKEAEKCMNEIEKELMSFYHAQSSNAIILADMLEQILNNK